MAREGAKNVLSRSAFSCEKSTGKTNSRSLEVKAIHVNCGQSFNATGSHPMPSTPLQNPAPGSASWPAELRRIVEFLEAVGLKPLESAVDPSSLLPGVTIIAGRVVYDSTRIHWPGDLLHEGGHIAVTPAALRPTLDATLPEPSVPHAGEVEATAWAYAAILAIGLDPSVLFHPGGYQSHSRGLAFSYSMGCFPGASGLCAAGLAHSPADAQRTGVPPYPHMIRWLRS